MFIINSLKIVFLCGIVDFFTRRNSFQAQWNHFFFAQKSYNGVQHARRVGTYSCIAQITCCTKSLNHCTSFFFPCFLTSNMADWSLCSNRNISCSNRFMMCVYTCICVLYMEMCVCVCLFVVSVAECALLTHCMTSCTLFGFTWNVRLTYINPESELNEIHPYSRNLSEIVSGIRWFCMSLSCSHGDSSHKIM